MTGMMIESLTGKGNTTEREDLSSRAERGTIGGGKDMMRGGCGPKKFC